MPAVQICSDTLHELLIDPAGAAAGKAPTEADQSLAGIYCFRTGLTTAIVVQQSRNIIIITTHYCIRVGYEPGSCATCTCTRSRPTTLAKKKGAEEHK